MSAVNANFFDNLPIKITDDISIHAQWIIDNFYKKNYPNAEAEFGIPRYVHGGPDVSRVAMFGRVFVNFYRRWEDPEALNLTGDDVKLLEIALLFHDSGNESDGKDEQWDRDSAVNCYWYLIKLGVNHEKAKLIAEAIANKDMHDNKYYHLEIQDGNVVWRAESVSATYKKNIYQKIIQNADDVDVIRARDKYYATELDFYKDIASDPKKPMALKEMLLLTTEARSLIELQGDGRETYLHKRSQGAVIKMKYEHATNCYKAVVADLVNTEYPLPLLSQLYANNQLLSVGALKNLILVDDQAYDPAKGITDENLMRALNNGMVWLRGLRFCSWELKNKNIVDIEIEKTNRKKGNPNRSMAAVGYGNPPFSNSGFILLSQHKQNIRKLGEIDLGSGYGNKTHLIGIQSNTSDQQISDFLYKLRLGGSITEFPFNDRALVSKHNEIFYDLVNGITEYNAIYFSCDPNISNDNFFDNPFPMHQYAPALEAIFTQNELKKNNIERLIVEFSYLHQFLKVRSFTPEKILEMWRVMCEGYIKKMLEEHKIVELNYQTIDEIKILSMFGSLKSPLSKDCICRPADSNYTDSQRNEITQTVTNLKNQYINEYIETLFQKILSKE